MILKYPPTTSPWVNQYPHLYHGYKSPKSIKIISKYYKYPLLRLNVGGGGVSEFFKSNKFYLGFKFVHKGEGTTHACSFHPRLHQLTHPPTHPPLCKKNKNKNHFQGNSGFSGFLEGFNEWIGENIFRGHNFFFHVEGCLMQILSGLVRVRPRLAGLLPPPPRPCGIDRSGMVQNVRPIPVEAHATRGRVGARIKLHPHVGAVRPNRHLHMCEMS